MIGPTCIDGGVCVFPLVGCTDCPKYNLLMQRAKDTKNAEEQYIRYLHRLEDKLDKIIELLKDIAKLEIQNHQERYK